MTILNRLSSMEPFVAYLDQHPFIEASRIDGLATARRISDVMSLTAFKRLDIYNEFFRKLGFDRQLIVGLPTSPITSVALCRCCRDFTEGDTRVLQALRPHLMTAVRTSTWIAELKAQLDSLGAC